MGSDALAPRFLFFLFAFCFTTGVALRSFVALPISFSFFLVFIFLALLSYYAFTRTKPVLLVLLCVLGLASGIIRFSVSALNEGTPVLDRHLGERIIFEGVVIEEPDKREQMTRLVVRADKLHGEASVLSEKILVWAERFPEWNYGDRISVRGVLKKPEAFAGDAGRIFDYPSYLSVEEIYYETAVSAVSLVGTGEGNPIRRALFSLKKGFVRKIEMLIPEPESSLLAGLLVGAKQSLGKELLDDFRRVGLIHIVVLSGYNLTIVADSIAASLRFLRPALAASLAGTGIVFFAVMVGGSATVVRASLMALLVILARQSGRVYDVTTALVLAGFLMLLQNPKILVYDVSFELSFLATIGLIYFSPLIEPYVRRLPERFGIREVAVATVATQLFVLPFILYKMGAISAVSLPANLLVLLFIPATMLFGFLAGVFGFLSTTLAFPFAFVASLLLSYELLVAETFATLPFSAVSFSSVPVVLVIAAYLAYAYIIYKKQKTV